MKKGKWEKKKAYPAIGEWKTDEEEGPNEIQKQTSLIDDVGSKHVLFLQVKVFLSFLSTFFFSLSLSLSLSLNVLFQRIKWFSLFMNLRWRGLEYSDGKEPRSEGIKPIFFGYLYKCPCYCAIIIDYTLIF